METTMDIIVRSTDLDRLGHVNNAKYLEYLEWARLDWYEQIGLNLEELHDQQIGTVVVNLNINYRGEAQRGDVLTIVTRPKRRGNTSFVVEQEIFNQNGKRIVDAEVTSVTFDLERRKAMPPLPELVHAFTNIM